MIIRIKWVILGVLFVVLITGLLKQDGEIIIVDELPQESRKQSLKQIIDDLNNSETPENIPQQLVGDDTSLDYIRHYLLTLKPVKNDIPIRYEPRKVDAIADEFQLPIEYRNYSLDQLAALSHSLNDCYFLLHEATKPVSAEIEKRCSGVSKADLEAILQIQEYLASQKHPYGLGAVAGRMDYQISEDGSATVLDNSRILDIPELADIEQRQRLRQISLGDQLALQGYSSGLLEQHYAYLLSHTAENEHLALSFLLAAVAAMQNLSRTQIDSLAARLATSHLPSEVAVAVDEANSILERYDMLAEETQ